MNIQTFQFNAFSENTHVIWNAEKQAIIIDPGMSDRLEESEFLNWLKAEELTVVDIWLTHCHIDHIMGLDFCFREFGLKGIAHALDQVNIERSELVAGMYGIPYTAGPEPEYLLQEGQMNRNGFETEVLFVPGHSPGHVAFYFEESGVVFSGDVLFERSIGRADLPGGNFETLADSIRTKMYALPEETVIYCGHGDTTTIGEEKNENPFVKEI
jgi:glyoxylase-like metal-dependent hydrolase (beta-lactamase superfamily II)